MQASMNMPYMSTNLETVAKMVPGRNIAEKKGQVRVTYVDVKGQRGSPTFPISFRVAWFRSKGMDTSSHDGRMVIGASVDKGSELETLVSALKPQITQIVFDHQDEFFPRDPMAKQRQYTVEQIATKFDFARPSEDGDSDPVIKIAIKFPDVTVGYNKRNKSEGKIDLGNAALTGDAAQDAREKAEIAGDDPEAAVASGGKIARNAIVYALVRCGCIWNNDAGYGLSLSVVPQKPDATHNIIVLQSQTGEAASTGQDDAPSLDLNVFGKRGSDEEEGAADEEEGASEEAEEDSGDKKKKRRRKAPVV